MAKKENKYAWRIGSPPPVLEQHSAVKHRIIENYVRNYIQTLMSQAHIPKLQLTLIDGFSGGGCYQVEDANALVDGSPLLMMRAVREARAALNRGRNKPRELCVNYDFIDIEPETIDYLNYWLNGRADDKAIDMEDKQRTSVRCADFLAELPRIRNEIKQRRFGERAIFVLDQYNYNDLPMAEMAGLMRDLKGSEIILTFNVGSLLTYISDHAANRKPMARIGLEKYIPWEQIQTLKATDSQRWRQILQRHVAHGIKTETGAQFATLFFVRPLGSNTWDYWLIHLSNHYKAHEVMKDLHWDHATEFGHELEPGVFMQGYDANKDDRYTQQSPFDFGPDSRQRCIEGIHEHLGQIVTALNQPITIRDLVYQSASRSPGSTQHYLEALKVLHHSQNIVVCGADGRVRRPAKNYSLSDVIEHSRRIRLI